MAACFFSSGFSGGLLVCFVSGVIGSFLVSCSCWTVVFCSGGVVVAGLEAEGSGFWIFGCAGSGSFFRISSTIFTPVVWVGSLGGTVASSFFGWLVDGGLLGSEMGFASKVTHFLFENNVVQRAKCIEIDILL